MFDKNSWTTWVLIVLVIVIVSVLAVLALRGTFEIPLGGTDVYKNLVDYALDKSA